MKKRAKVHLLPTGKASGILVNTYINETHSTSKFVVGVTKDTLDQIPVEEVELRGYKYQHLYITTDDEIKEDDTWINLDTNTIHNGNLFELANRAPSCKKIIATTNPKLHSTRLKACPINPEDNMVSIRGVSKLPKSFIEEYCKAGGIDEVYVEYEDPVNTLKLRRVGTMAGEMALRQAIFGLQPKLTQNNEIIIHPIEEKMYTESDLMTEAEAKELEDDRELFVLGSYTWSRDMRSMLSIRGHYFRVSEDGLTVTLHKK